jgi:hypothetical protein
MARKRRPKNLMDRGTNETPGSGSKGGRHKPHLEPPYKTNMSSSGPDLRLERRMEVQVVHLFYLLLNRFAFFVDEEVK